MNDDRNNPKPLPDDFGMTLPNFRLPRQNQANEADLPTTNLRSTPPPQSVAPPTPSQPPADFGMTIPNLKAPNQPSSANNFDQTVPNLKPNQANQIVQQPDYGMTLNNFHQPNPEENYQATISYLPRPAKTNHETKEFNRNAAPNNVQTEPEKKSGVPLWAWLVGGGVTALLLLTLGGIALYIWWSNLGYTLVVTDVPQNSTVYIDGTQRGVRTPEGITVYGIKAGEKRSVKVAREGCSDFNSVIVGSNGETKTLIAQMDCSATPAPSPSPVPTTCTDDPRVCSAEEAAMDALDRLQPPFTADDLVRALNLHIINFESNKSDIPFARKRFLEKAAEKFKQLPATSVIEIGGHTDNVGGADANLLLSQDRAKAVRAVLVTFGVSPNMLTTKGYGSVKPKTDNATENGKFANRRIEYNVVAR